MVHIVQGQTAAAQIAQCSNALSTLPLCDDELAASGETWRNQDQPREASLSCGRVGRFKGDELYILV
jgi:hypothetical protein